MTPAMIRTENSVTVLLNGTSYTFTTDHPNYRQVLQSIRDKVWSRIPDLMSVATTLFKSSRGHYQLENNVLLYTKDGVRRELPVSFTNRVMSMLANKEGVEYLLKFHDRLEQNPSLRSREQLFTFLENANIPIDEEGYFYAYKSIRNDWMDIHSGTFCNKVGTEVKMDRHDVDDDPNRTCSRGLHVGALPYVSEFGGPDSRRVIVKVDPADVVSVPTDYSGQKMRVCRYVVVAEYTGPLSSTYVPSDNLGYDDSSEDDYEDYDDDFYDDEEEADEEATATPTSYRPITEVHLFWLGY